MVPLMKRRTSVILDTELLDEAGSVLGTTRTTEVIRLALMEVVNRDKRRRLVALEMPDLTPESLDRARRGWQSEFTDRFPPT